jgi:hypothetical protein
MTNYSGMTLEINGPGVRFHTGKPTLVSLKNCYVPRDTIPFAKF